MIYTITLKNKKTDREVSKYYNLGEALENINFNMELAKMKEALEDDEEKF